MAEQNSSDPNQPHQPVEEDIEASIAADVAAEGGLISDTVTEETGQENDKDKARVMAEAGAKYRNMARVASEHELPPGAQQIEYRAHKSNRMHGQDGVGLSVKEMFDKKAVYAEDTAGEAYEAARSSDFSKDPEKAMAMERASRLRTRNLAEKTPLEAANNYDLERAEREVGKSLAEVLEEIKDREHDTSKSLTVAYLKFAHLIAEYGREIGDPISPNIEALDLIYKFTGGWTHKTLQEYGHNRWVHVNFKGNGNGNGAIEVKKGGEKWHLPMFDDDPKGHRFTGTYAQPRDYAYYEVTERSADPDGAFDTVEITKKRAFGDQDMAKLKKVVREVDSFAMEKRANTLYPGDDGYEEELAEINYGRD